MDFRNNKHRLAPVIFGAMVFVATTCVVPSSAEGATDSTTPPVVTTVRSIQVGDLQRSYRLHAPHPSRDTTQATAQRARALVLVFHGGGGTGAQVERETKFSDLADREGFVVAYPEGLGRGWNDGRGVMTIPSQRDRVDDVGFVAALIDDIAKDHAIDAKRIYATGISNGAMFSHHLAAHLASRIAAIAPVVGGMPEPLSQRFGPEQPVSVLIVQGTDDPLVPYAGGDVTPPGIGTRGRVIGTEAAARRWAEHNGCASDRDHRVVPSEVVLPDKDPHDGCRVYSATWCSQGKGRATVSTLRLQGAGHTWPDSPQSLPRSMVGGVCRDINGTQVIWDFFKNHAKP